MKLPSGCHVVIKKKWILRRICCLYSTAKIMYTRTNQQKFQLKVTFTVFGIFGRVQESDLSLASHIIKVRTIYSFFIFLNIYINIHLIYADMDCPMENTKNKIENYICSTSMLFKCSSTISK